MSKEKKQKEMKNNIDEFQKIITGTDENINIFNETYKKFNLITYNIEELNKFKDNILSLLKERDKIYIDKLNEYKSKAEKIKTDFDSVNKLTNSKFSNIIGIQAKMNSRIDQLDNYESFVTKTNEKLTSHEIRLNNIREDFSKATQKYDKIYLDNMELPGYIGPCAKYKNCQIFFLEVIKDLATLNKYREKNIIDLKMYKDKLETIINSINAILDNNNESQIKYINDAKEKILKDCNNMFESVCDNMKEIRVENSKYAVDLISHSMDLSKKWEKIEKIREDLLEKFNYSVNKYQMLTDDTIKSFEDFKAEYNIIRRKFMELAEFIKDVRFRKNIGENVKKKEVKAMVKKILRKRKSIDGKDVQLLDDIESVENIDYKKYYNVETKNDDDNNKNENTENKSNSLKISRDKKNERYNSNSNSNSNIHLYKYKNKRNYKSFSKEIIYNKNLNKTADGSRSDKMNIKNATSSTTNGNNNNLDYSSKSINISPINFQNLKNNSRNRNNNSELLNNKNSENTSIKKENNIDIKFKNDFISYHKRSNNIEKNESNKSSKEKTNNELKINDYNSKKNNEYIYINDSQNMNQKDNQYYHDKMNKLNDNKTNVEVKPQLNDKGINTQDVNTQNTNTIINSNINEKNETCNQTNNNKNLEKNDEISQISLSRIMSHKSNIEIRHNVNDDTSSIMTDGYNTNPNNNVNSNDNNNIGLSSEKSLSFISENNNNNINKFLINDIQIGNNDKIIKELASELEQSTAKKDKLASNKKEIEQKFKNICNHIEPINLLGQKGNNLKINSNSNENNNNEHIINNNKIDNKINNELLSNKRIKDNNNDNISNKDNIELQEKSILKEDNNNFTSNNINNINKSINESINNLNPIKVNNEIYINDGFNSNSFHKKMHVFDQKLLNLELFTKEKILDLISQINAIKHICNIPANDSITREKTQLDLSKISYLPNKALSNPKYKTFNSSFINNQNISNFHQNSFYSEKNKENISSINNENNNTHNMNNISNTQYILNKINIDKKRYSLREVNSKQSSLNQKISKKNNINNNMSNNTYFNNTRQYNGNKNEIIDETNTKIIHNINNDINCKFLKEIEKKVENGNLLKNCMNNDDLNNKSLNCGSNRNSFAYNNSIFKGAEIKLVDLNKLVNKQLPRNRLIPIHINDNDYFVPLNSK